MENPGLYIHIPFCRRKCTYCAFYSVASFDAGKTASYLQALLAEARWFASHRFHDAKPKIRTVYIGGGTPSILPVSFYSALFEGLESCFDFSGCIEWSFEANPEHLGQAYLSELWKNTPIRRLSIGLQSFRDEDLHVLKRWHTGREAVEAIGMARNAGFKNLSVDLMYGLWQEEGLRHWKKNLMKLAELDVPHFSAYALTLEPGTLLWKRVKQGMAHMAPDEEIEEEFKELQAFAKRNGYEHYEISNLARPGFEAVHNSNYWREIPYIGLGASAHSFIGNERSWNVARLEEYVRDPASSKERESLSEEDRYHEYVMTALRTSRGVEKSRLAAFQESFREEFLERAAAEMKKGNMAETEDSYVVRENRRLLTDAIAETFF